MKSAVFIGGETIRLTPREFDREDVCEPLSDDGLRRIDRAVRSSVSGIEKCDDTE